MAYSREQLYTAIRNADKAGDADAVRKLSAELQRVDAKPAAPQAAPSKPENRPTSFWKGVAERAPVTSLNMARLSGNPTGNAFAPGPFGAAMGAALDLGGAAIQAGMDKFSKGGASRGSTAGRVVGDVIGTIPTMLIPGSGLRAAISQGVAGGFLSSDNIRNKPEAAINAGIGGAGGALGYGAGKVISKGIRKVVPPRIPVAAPKLPRDAAVRSARFNRVGVQHPTTAMVTRDPAAYKFQQDMLANAAQGQPIQQALRGVDLDLARSARGLVDLQGGAIGPEAMGDRVIKAAQSRDKALSDRVGSLYKQVRDNFGDARVPALDNLKAAQIHPDWADNTAFDDMVAAVNKRLSRYADADGGRSGLNVSQAEELRKFIGGLGQNSSQTFAMRRVLQDALDTDVIDNIGGAPFADARAAAAARFGEFRGTLPGKIAGEMIAPERVGARLRGAGTSLDDMRALRSTLENSPGGAEALQSLRSQMLDDVFSKGITPDNGVNGTTIYNEFSKAAPRLRTVLDPADYKQARHLAIAARDATAAVPKSGFNTSGTAQSLLGAVFPEGAPAKTGLLGSFLRNPLGRAAAHTLANSVTPGAGSVAVEGAAMASSANASRLADQAIARQVTNAIDPASAMQALSDEERRKLIEALIAREGQRLGRYSAGPAGALGVLAGYNLIGQN